MRIMPEPAAAAAAPVAGTRTEKIVIVMPAYNAARTLEETFRAIPEGYYDEIVVVDDHSRDDTLELRAPAPPEGDPPSAQRRLRRQPEDLLHGGAARRRHDRRDAAPGRPVRSGDHPGDDPADPRGPRRHGAGLAHDDAGRRARRRHAALEADRQPLPDDAREPGDGPALHRVPHRLPRLQPPLPRDGAVPAQLERLRVRHRGDLPGRPLRAAGGRGAGRVPLLRRTPPRSASARASSTASARSGRPRASCCTARGLASSDKLRP